MDIFELFEEGTKKGLKDTDIPSDPNDAAFGNPQRLTMAQLEQRMSDLKNRCDTSRNEQWARD